MLDLELARRIAADGRPDHVTTVSLRWIAQAIKEIEDGRRARHELALKQSGKPRLDHDAFARPAAEGRQTMSGHRL